MHGKRFSDEFSYFRNKFSKSYARKRSCTEKIKYKTQTQAAQDADERNHERCIKYSDVHPYKCGYCSGWHIGHGKGIAA